MVEWLKLILKYFFSIWTLRVCSTIYTSPPFSFYHIKKSKSKYYHILSLSESSLFFYCFFRTSIIWVSVFVRFRCSFEQWTKAILSWRRQNNFIIVCILSRTMKRLKETTNEFLFCRFILLTYCSTEVQQQVCKLICRKRKNHFPTARGKSSISCCKLAWSNHDVK